MNSVFWYSMRKSTWLALALVVGAGAQESRRPEFDPRLTVHTLVREDIFAGFLVDDMERFSRGEKTLERLMVERPESNVRSRLGAHSAKPQAAIDLGETCVG